MNGLRKFLARNANNYRGWRTKRKIIVIESDDWGSICMPSKNVFDQLVDRGYCVDRNPYTSFDSLASEEDLTKLFLTLKEFKNKKGESPVITANTIIANPDFDKIRSSDFNSYYYESFKTTLKKYPDNSHGNSFELWKKGVNEGVFIPQFHGREHLQVKGWMNSILDSASPYRKVFDSEVVYLGKSYGKNNVSLRASFEANQRSEFAGHKQILKEGLQLFGTIFGSPSKSFIAPNYVYHPDLNKTLSDEGVEIIQGMKYQKLPRLGKPSHKMIRHFQGEKNGLGQIYLVRNCVFEPSQYPESHDNVGECLKGIKNAFFWKKPAIISAHRLNFIGYINPENRKRNLLQFRELLHRILKEWPDVEFMTSVELGMLMGGK